MGEKTQSRKEVKIKDCMSSQLFGVPGEANMLEVSQMMAQRDIGSMLIKAGEDIVGIITEKDLIRKVMAQGLDAKSVTAESIMSFPITTIDQEASMEEAHQMMSEQNIRHLMVTQDDKPVGMISVRTWLDASQ